MSMTKDAHLKGFILGLIVLLVISNIGPIVLGNNNSNIDLSHGVDTDMDCVFDQNTMFSSQPQFELNLLETSFSFEKVWESDITEGLCDVAIDTIDDDELQDICVPFYDYDNSSAFLTIYENDADNSFHEVYRSESQRYGVINALEIADINDDGYKEILAGHYKTKLRIFESDGDDSYVEKPYIDVGASTYYFKKIEVADTNNNDENEIIIVKNDPAGSTGYWGYITIWEDNQKIFEEDSYIYFSGLTVGDLDRDDYLDIIVTHGGWGFEPFWIDHYEYNGVTYERKVFYLDGYTGLPLRGQIADTDLDGENELIIAGVANSNRTIFIIESTGDDEFQLDEEIIFPSTTNPMDISIRDVMFSSYPEIAVCTHSSGGIAQAFLFSYDDDNYNLLYNTSSELLESACPWYSIDLTFADQDESADIIIAVDSTMDKAIMLEYQSEDQPAELEINFKSSGFAHVCAEIKNIGSGNASNISWTLDIPTIIPGRWHWNGSISSLTSGESELICSSGFMVGFGKLDITMTAKADNAEEVLAKADGFIFIIFVLIR